jgi:hypothetical protein
MVTVYPAEDRRAAKRVASAPVPTISIGSLLGWLPIIEGIPFFLGHIRCMFLCFKNMVFNIITKIGKGSLHFKKEVCIPAKKLWCKSFEEP